MWELGGSQFNPSRREFQSIWSKWILFAILLSPFLCISQTISTINHLEGEAGFRMASLQWKYPAMEKTPVSFRVRYCELHAWGLHRCRYQVVETNSTDKNNLPGSNRTGRSSTSSIGSSKRLGAAESNEIFLIEIGGLRMATNYSFQVVPQDKGMKVGGRPSQISLQTKGFSAKATKCLADSSEVSVETGPFFGGRISVEESEIPGCFVKGDPQSPQTKYSLRIRHSECGSLVNGSKVTTIILVQENLPILTHSTRKFVVVCSFSPESFIVKTGVSLPRETSVAKAIDFSGLIRLSPQGTNLLMADKSEPGSRRAHSRISPSSPSPQPDPENKVVYDEDNSLNKDFSTPVIPSKENSPLFPTSRRQSRAYMNSAKADPHLSPLNEQMVADPTGSGSGRANPETYGTWEGVLVLGMICVAVVASISAVGWFAKSYHRTASQKLKEDPDDRSDGSSSSPSSISFDESLHNFDSGRVPHNLDTRSEFEVELDFEFSEERNYGISTNPNSSGLNKSNSFHVQLDSIWSHQGSASQA